MTFDRDAILARTDLAQLADELLGGHKGSGTGARWPSPVPGHPQTGKTPPMTIFRARNGVERWTCWATGASGTAIDLLMMVSGVSVREALERLAARAGMREGDAVERIARRPPSPTPASGIPNGSDLAAMRSYVATCEAVLWSSRGRSVRKWLLEERRLDPEVLRANHVGADPGPRVVPRATGLPRGVGVVFPALDQERRIVYLQLRRLAGNGPKYQSPSTRVFGVSPRLAWIVSPEPQSDAVLVVAEGICDGLTAAGAGVPAVALLGAMTPNNVIADRLAAGGPLLLALDADTTGRASSNRLRSLLSSAGRREVAALSIPDNRDLNEWAQELGPRFGDVLRASIASAAARTAGASQPGRLGRDASASHIRRGL